MVIFSNDQHAVIWNNMCKDYKWIKENTTGKLKVNCLGNLWENVLPDSRRCQSEKTNVKSRYYDVRDKCKVAGVSVYTCTICKSWIIIKHLVGNKNNNYLRLELYVTFSLMRTQSFGIYYKNIKRNRIKYDSSLSLYVYMYIYIFTIVYFVYTNGKKMEYNTIYKLKKEIYI